MQDEAIGSQQLPQ
jgi:hypothetical protein